MNRTKCSIGTVYIHTLCVWELSPIENMTIFDHVVMHTIHQAHWWNLVNCIENELKN